MLLSRVADALYWLSRYLERAEHTARVIDVAVDLGLGRGGTLGDGVIGRLYRTLGFPPAETRAGLASLADAAFFDITHPNSVVSCVTAGRENARQVREEISSEMWEQLNELYLRMRQIRDDAGWRSGRTHYLSRSVIAGIHLFQGVTDATMGHGEGWQFLRAGRFLERAEATASLLDVFLKDALLLPSDGQPLDQAEWVGLLRSCSALEAYCRHYTADVRPERVADFLLLNAAFPRSVRFAAANVESALLEIARWSGRRGSGRAERLAGRLHASLDYGHVDEILNDDPSAYLAGVTRQCVMVHSAIYQAYIGYPIEQALPA
jgi:uncharacterized alpha-E superfamily protein